MKYIMAHSDTVGLSPTHPSSSHHSQSICAVRYGNLCKGHKTKAFYRSLLFNATRLRRELSIILICNRKVVQNWTTWKKGKAFPPEESKREGSKAWDARQNLEKNMTFLLLFPLSLWVYIGTVTEKDENLISAATVHLQIGTLCCLVIGKN